MLVLADTGVLLRLVNRGDALHLTVRTALRALKRRGDDPVAATQNIAEFWNVCTRPASSRGGFALSVNETAKGVRLVERLVRIVPDTPAAYPVWKALLTTHGVKGVQVHDARLVALMSVHGITHILTLNKSDFARYPGVVAQAPTDLLTSTSLP